MKLNGIVGKGSGKLGASVWSISGGEQVVRAYNPQVTNPNTDAQVAQRAKLKLMSQLAAALAPALAFKKNGLISARNQFVSKNIGLATFEDGVADVELIKLQLTPGIELMEAPVVIRGENDTATARLQSDWSARVDNVIYVTCVKTIDAKLYVLGIVKAQPGSNGEFQATIPMRDDNCVVYAYGVKFNSAADKAKFSNYIAEQGETTASLPTSVAALLANGTFTATNGTEIAGL